VELALDEPLVISTLAEFVFQSLFSWNLLLMHLLISITPTWSGVSILVFVELALDAEMTTFHLEIECEFQSLFSWNLLLMLSPGIGSSNGRTGFNPCFRGTCS